MQEFKNAFEKLGYTFPSEEILEDLYQFYKYYNSEVNEGVATVLFQGDMGKTFLSKVFCQYLGTDTEYIKIRCAEEIFNLKKIISMANAGKKVVLVINDEKNNEFLNSSFFDFLQEGRIILSDETLVLTEEGRKRLYVIFFYNNKSHLYPPLLRRSSFIKILPFEPELVCKILLRKFENLEHDANFLEFICKVYEAIYKSQVNNNKNAFVYLPSIQELAVAITSDNELYKNGITIQRRINNFVRKLSKDSESRKILIRVLVEDFNYFNQDNEFFEINNLIYNESRKDEDDETKVYDDLKNDSTLHFLDKENKKTIVELGVITHENPKAIKALFKKVGFRGNPNCKVGFLNFEGENFIGIRKHKNTLILVANREYISPRLFIRGLCTLITIIYDFEKNTDMKHLYFSQMNAQNFKLAGLDVKILSNLPPFVFDKMSLQNGEYVYQKANLKIKYSNTFECSYFRYMQMFKAEPLYEAIKKICSFNPELALPASFINAKKFDITDRNIFRKLSHFNEQKKYWENLKLNGWDVHIDEFVVMKLKFFDSNLNNENWNFETEEEIGEEPFVFEWKTKRDEEKKKLYVFPKYKLKGEYLLYSSEADFENDEAFKNLDPFQKDIALFARSIFGNFIPVFSSERNSDYFSSLTMSQMGRIVEDENNRCYIPGIRQDITIEPEFIQYYDSISHITINTQNKVLRRTLNEKFL